MELPDTFYPDSRLAWRNWMQAHHLVKKLIWLIYFKKNSNIATLSYSDAAEEALCFGWIDSTYRPIDDTSYMQLFTPRKEKSEWSALNKERVERLTALGLMMPAGLQKIEIAQRNGSWNHLNKVESLEPPDELNLVFAANEPFRMFYQNLSKTAQKQILHHLNTTKQPETKQKRIAAIVAASEKGRLPDRFYNKETLQKIKKKEGLDPDNI
jgi:uncharacterized protein YdeI (YjbR/CyaY-like superfamily)